MPDTEDNLKHWNSVYEWSDAGEEWSSAWGGVETQWHGTIFPRIQRHLPVHTILEIAPGFGRWTQFLASHCERLILVDLSGKCIEACRARFRGHDHIEYYVNDGRSMPFVGNRSVDFVFSFDSLVHVDANVIESYVNELGRVLTPGGVGFLHHSNLAERLEQSAIHRFLASHRRTRAIVRRAGLLRLRRPLHGRALDVSASVFRAYAEAAGISCISQEVVNWGGEDAIDCLSTIEKSGAACRQTVKTLHNPHFMREASYLAQLSRLYGKPKAEV